MIQPEINSYNTYSKRTKTMKSLLFKTIFIVMGLFLFCYSSIAQEIEESYETLLLEETQKPSGGAFKPIIGGGLGSFLFLGDVNDYMILPTNGLSSARVSISRNVSKNFDIEFHGTFGAVSGNQYMGDSTGILNFRTDLFMGGVSVVYNFNHFIKRQRPIHPYISLGAEILQFRPKGDLLSENGTPYHYWNDGTLRDKAQQPGVKANILGRDFVYETDLKELNLQGLGSYPDITAAIPIDLGVQVTITDRTKARLGACLHYSLTDMLDNVKKSGGLGNDFVINTYVSISFDLFSPAEEIEAVEHFRNLKFTITDKEDEDDDKVDDFNDECLGTLKGVKVNFRGCPDDSDNDGVPDYKDMQEDTPKDAISVDANGIKVPEIHVIAKLYDPDAISRNQLRIYNKKDFEAPDTKDFKKLPDYLKSTDINGDGKIQKEELDKAIEDFFDMNSTLTEKQLNELQNFYFQQ